MKNYQQVADIADFIRIIDKLKESFARTKMATELSFRGQSNTEHNLIPNIYRRGSKGPRNIVNPTFRENDEYEILSHFIKEACGYIKGVDQSDYLAPFAPPMTISGRVCLFHPVMMGAFY